MLEIKNVHKRFGGIHAIENVSILIEKGKIWSMIGPNGAGKTTLFNLITGTLSVDSGKIDFLGENITNLKPFKIAQKGISRTYQQKNLYPNLSVYENILAGVMKEKSREIQSNKKVLEIIDFLSLNDVKKEIVSNLDPLHSKLVELGRALATSPKLILLDELIGGLIPSETEKICKIIEILKDEGYTIFQIGHEMGPIMKTSDWVFVLNEGQKIAEGTPEEIQKNKLVHEIYLE